MAEARTVRERAAELADRIAAREGCEVAHCEFVKEGPGWVLRVYIDRRGGVGLEDCTAVSRQLSTALDVEDFIDRSYSLEVSSPGVFRPLFEAEDYQRFVGERVRIKTMAPVRGRRTFVGELGGLEDGTVTIHEPGGQTFEIPLDKVGKANLEPELD